jgi:MarR family transcriptional regulator, 2-MHQ and catechol-resistance regulon repressor
MTKKGSDPVHCWLVWRKAHEAASDYLYRGIEETGISDTDFRVLEVLLHKGPLPVNTIGPKVHLTPGSISVAVDRLLAKGLVSRAETLDDRRIRIVALTKAGKDLIVPIFRKHSAEIGKVFADASPKDLQILESLLKKAGKRARGLAEERNRQG